MWVQSLGWEEPLEKEMATTPVFLPGKSYGQRRLAGYSLWCWTDLVTKQICLVTTGLRKVYDISNLMFTEHLLYVSLCGIGYTYNLV